MQRLSSIRYFLVTGFFIILGIILIAIISSQLNHDCLEHNLMVKRVNIITKSAAGKKPEPNKNISELMKSFQPFQPVLFDASNLVAVPNKPKLKQNKRFYFHNKLPRSGSTTLYNILRQLAVKNKFYFTRLQPDMISPADLSLSVAIGDFIKWFNQTIDGTLPLQANGEKPAIFLMKEHFPVSFKNEKIDNPTYINVIREPTSWFQSNFYFDLDRDLKYGLEAENITINECIQRNHKTCRNTLKWTFMKYFCLKCPKKETGAKYIGFGHGNSDPSYDDSLPNPDMESSLNSAKHSILNQFYVVGVVEYFDLTLKLFEVMMPEVFEGASVIADNMDVKETPKTKNVEKLTDQNRYILKRGLLKYQTDLYEFTKAVFFRQLKDYGLVVEE